MILVGLAAFVLNLSLLRGDGAPVLVAVAAADLPLGTPISDDLVEFVESDATDPLVDRLITEAEFAAFEGQVLGATVHAGDPLVRTAVLAVPQSGILRSFSIPIDVERAAGGVLRVGDRVDVIVTGPGEATYVASGLEVLDVPDTERRGLTGAGAYFVVVGVDSGQALALAAAVDDGDLHLVRSTGAPSPEVQRYRAGPAAEEPAR